MAAHERGRSPSATRLNNSSTNNHPSSSTASPLPSFDASSFVASDNGAAPTHFSTSAFQDPILFDDTTSYNTFAQQQGSKGPLASGLAAQGDDLAFFQSQGYQSNTLSDLDYSLSSNPLNQQDSTAFPAFEYPNDAALDPSLLSDPDLQHGLGASLDPMAAASMPSHSPTPPHLMPDMGRAQSARPSPNASPNFQPATFGRPRNVSDSLDPSSAMFPPNQTEWANVGAYRTHRRTPSDQYSDYSSHSNQASPYLPTYDSFDANAHSSPLLNAQQDPAFNDGLGLQQFTLNENQAPQTYHTPGHSPRLSPQVVPQQPVLPMYAGANEYGVSADQFAPQNNGLDMFPPTGSEPFPQLNKPLSPGDFGHADQMSPPEINVEYAPPAVNPNQMVRSNNDGEALSPPPARTQSRNRMRAKSDSYAGSRSPSPALGRGRSPSLQPNLSGGDSLAPFDNASSRSSSPGGREKSATRARSSSHASDQRDYILGLAEPERTPSNGVKDNGRVQKHPATFQCHLCPKRFTRAYNLRSHLRTHTDERPFVCTVCGKAFARQHDRKRHEGLHSGEKKFVCKGNLQSGVQWGCGRRFARADALGRHFRSEAGRVCIKPLLDEEAQERNKSWNQDQQAQAQAQASAAGLVAPPPLLSQGPMDLNTNFFPAVLLQQYPALAGIDWNSVPQGPPPEEDYSGRSSFEASSGGEYYDDMSENEMGGYPDAQMGGMNAAMGAQQGMSMQAQQPQAYATYGGQSTGDYLSDFEGR